MKAEALLKGMKITDAEPEVCHIYDLERPNTIGPTNTVGVFIPLVSSNSDKPPMVEIAGTPVDWNLGDYIVVFGDNTLIPRDEMIRFGLLRYQWTPVKQAGDASTTTTDM
jgi:hypothetical protein